MKITYSDKNKNHIIDGEDTVILSKGEYGLQVKNLKNFTIKNITVAGQWGKYGKIKQLITAFKFIFNITFSIKKRLKMICEVTLLAVNVFYLGKKIVKKLKKNQKAY